MCTQRIILSIPWNFFLGNLQLTSLWYLQLTSSWYHYFIIIISLLRSNRLNGVNSTFTTGTQLKIRGDLLINLNNTYTFIHSSSSSTQFYIYTLTKLMLPGGKPVDGEGVACEAWEGGLGVAVGLGVKLEAYYYPAPVPFEVAVELVALL